jgi:hypothetical protein
VIEAFTGLKKNGGASIAPPIYCGVGEESNNETDP